MSFESGSSSSEKKKKIAIIGVSCVLLVAVVVGVAVGISGTDDKDDKPAPPKGGGDSGQLQTSNKAIESICQPTNYKETCENSLKKAAGNVTDPQKLVLIGFQAAIEALEEATKNSSTVKELALDPMAKQALDNCEELLDNAIEDLRNSFNSLGEFHFEKMDEFVESLRIWLSATITYQQTCLDGFENTTGEAGHRMKEILVASGQLTSNALAMVTGLADIFKSMNFAGMNRRLLESSDDKFPTWVTPEKRRLLQATPATIKPDMIVAQDGSGQFKTINEAVHAISKNSNTTFVLYIKAGVYKEVVALSRSLTNIMMIGDGPTKTKITGDLSYTQGVQTFKTSTVSISGNHFMAKDIGFENTAGAIGHQAVALRVQADMSVFYNCQIDGYQDTLYAHTNRQFYRDCTISGTIDFVFGNSATVFQNCKMVVRKPLDNQRCIVTAHGRNESHQPTGFVIQNCTFMADPEYFPVRFINKAYLGRPWKEYSKTIIMESQIDDLIDPEGWLPWLGNFGLETSFYAEYNNRGPGAALDKRVTWNSIKKLTPQEAEGYTAANFFLGNTWIPATGVPYSPGFMSTA
ncbi:hypothetical protein K2173_022448 [Erythroxylum novogranatense]|uniref:Pectinesterase n=1 Tax=Erythroxylum novogranatense TaxID=1862640 RepID=A0AAV8TJQ9_9ROSI|nr:hypothetical protein K2173_022448 [Erythroxylum novogranatense]